MRNSKTAAALSKAIKTLETANAKILQERKMQGHCHSYAMVSWWISTCDTLPQKRNGTYRSGSITSLGQFILRGDDTVITKDEV